MKNALSQLWQQAGTRFNLLFAGGVVGIQATVIGLIRDVTENQAVSYTLAAVLLGALVLETVALFWKQRELRTMYAGIESSFMVFVLWFVHLIFGPIMIMLAFTALGYENPVEGVLPMTLIFGIVIRDIAILMMFMALEPLPKEADLIKIKKRGKIADALFIVFALLSYFFLWDGLVAASEHGFAGRPFLSTIGELIAAIIVFGFFFLGSRIGPFIEESYAIQAGKKEFGMIFTIVLAGAAAIVPLYFI